MLENSRHLLALCVVCGVVGSYFISLYILVFALVACIYIFFNDSKLLGQGVSAVGDFAFPVSSWIKSVISSLMNSYHLSKPPEPEPNQRRNAPYSPNLPIPRRQSCRSGRFTCLDENTDYVNRRNGIGLCSANSPFNNSYTNSIHDFRRQSGFNDADNSSKTEEFVTSQTSPWARRQNYSGNEFSSVRRVQTVAGPLLATSGLTKRKSNDFGLYVDANSPGLASRIVQYREDGTSPGGTVWTHQPQYGSPGQFPMVHLSHSSSSLPVLSPLSSQKASRRSVRVKIAPPDPLGSRLYPLSTKSNISYTSTLADHSTKSVLETLKEISRKRIHSQLEEHDDDAVKRQKRNAPSDILASQGNDIEGENMSKRLREESPRQPELSPLARPAKRIRNNEILSSLSSSRKLIQGGSMKRKTHNLDWSRCSTPVIGKQQKTVDGEEINALSSSSCEQNTSAKSAASVTPSMLSQALQKEKRTPSENERIRSNSLSLTKPSSSGKDIQKSKLQVTPKLSQKGPIVPIDDSPWQKDSPFVTVSSPDDIIDDISALEEKREEDRRSRLMSMMTVISGGEPPVKMPATTAEDPTAVSSEQSTFTSTVTVGNSSLTAPTVTTSSINLPSRISPEKATFGTSTLSNNWSLNSNILLTSPAPDSGPAASENPKPSIPAVTSSGTPVISSPSFNFVTPVPVSSASPAVTNNVDTPVSTPSVISANNAPLFGTLTQTQQTPAVSSPLVFGSAQSLFCPSPTTSSENIGVFSSQPQLTESLTASNKSGENVSFSIANAVSFGMPKSSVPQPTTSVTTTVTSTSATSTSTSMFQLRPAVSGLGQENSVSSSSGFVSSTSTVDAGTSSVQTNIFSKTAAFGAPEKSTGLITSGVTVFGSPVTTSSISSSVFGSTTTSTPDSQIKPGLFSFGNSAGSSSNPQAVASSNAKLVFGNTTGAFGQAVETSGNDPAPSQPSHSTSNNKVGGFKFNLTSGKTLFSNQSHVSSSETTNVFGNPNTTTVATNSESKQFAFGSSKPMENTFTLNAPSNTSTATSSQIQTTGNIFGTSALQAKQSESDMPKENLFSFGGSATANPVFATPQPGGFSAQPTTTITTTTTGFSFSSAAPSGFSQLSSGTGGFSMQANVTSTANFATPSATTTVPNSAFTFGSSSSNQSSQSNMFSFGASSTTSDLQSGNMFAFGSSNSPAPSSGTGLFSQPSAPVARVQPQSVPTQTPGQAPAATASPPQAFQFGTSSNPQQISGAFSFGSSSNASVPPSGFSSSGSFQVNAGGFGSGPAMFSIGSGTTAPRVRSARTRRTK